MTSLRQFDTGQTCDQSVGDWRLCSRLARVIMRNVGNRSTFDRESGREFSFFCVQHAERLLNASWASDWVIIAQIGD